ncbi:MAG TPA: DUF2334 domain-containing protein [bacterium]
MIKKFSPILFVLVIFQITISLSLASDTLIFIIRVDDILSRNTTIQPRSIVPFQQAVESRGGKVTWAVIPHRLIEAQNQDGNLVKELIASAANGHEIAQHGYLHICPFCQGYHEFYCTTYNRALSYGLQDSLISAGEKILVDSLGIQPVTFVPPSHQADNTTYQVLLDYGFPWISTAGAPLQYIYEELYNTGIQNDYTWALTPDQYQSKLHNALRDIENQRIISGCYAMLFHDYFTRSGYENGLVIQWTGELLDSLNARYGDLIQYKTIREAGEYFFGKTSSVVSNEPGKIEGYVLDQNYPNPFNPTTTIRYHLPKTSMVNLSIFNMTGQLVHTLANEWQTAGVHLIALDSETFQGQSGVYFYRIRAGEYTATRKCLVVK